ncbi:hypothetical protein AB1I63_10785 [Streptococcus pneumoniae]
MNTYKRHKGSYLGYYYKSGLHLRMDYESYQVHVEKILEISKKSSEEGGYRKYFKIEKNTLSIKKGLKKVIKKSKKTKKSVDKEMDR